MLLGTLGAARSIARRTPENPAQPLATIADQIDGWHVAADSALDARVINALAPTEYLQRRYRKDATDLDLFIAYYAQQKAGESMHSPKHCLPGSGWEIWKQGSADVSVSGRNERINQYGIENNGTRMLMFYWYQSGRRIIASEYAGKLLLARDSVMTGRTAAAIVRIVLPDKEGAAEEAVSFAAAMIPQVDRCFQKH